jgi:non-ribosomal peptide synthase protein (TIGR01720 family)
VALSKTEYDLSSQIKSIKEQLRQIPNNGLGYGVLKYYTETLNSGDQKYIRFNYLGDFDDMSQNHLFNISNRASGSESSDSNHMTALIDINAMILNKRLEVAVTYSSNKFKSETIHELTRRFFEHLREIIDFCTTREYIEHTASDYDMVDFSQDDIEDLMNQFEIK